MHCLGVRTVSPIVMIMNLPYLRTSGSGEFHIVLIVILDVLFALGILAFLLYLLKNKVRSYSLHRKGSRSHQYRSSWYHLRSFLLPIGRASGKPHESICSSSCDHEKGYCSGMVIASRDGNLDASLSGASLTRVLAYINALPPDTNDFLTIREVSIRSESEIGSEGMSEKETAIDLGWLEIVRDFPRLPDAALLPKRQQTSNLDGVVSPAIDDEYLPPNPANFLNLSPVSSSRPGIGLDMPSICFPSDHSKRDAIHYSKIGDPSHFSTSTMKSWSPPSGQQLRSKASSVPQQEPHAPTAHISCHGGILSLEERGN